MSLWQAVTSIFLPRIRVAPAPSLYEGDPEQARKERPLPTASRTRWYQGDLEAAIAAADTGDISLAASLCKAMRRDGTLSGVLSTRAGGLTRLPKVYRGTPEVLCELEDQEGVGLFDRVFGAKELELFVTDGILLGVAIGELVYIPGQDAPVFVRLDPEMLRYRWSEDRWYYMTDAGAVPITPGDGRWILHLPGGYQQPWNNALWTSLGRAFIAKEHAYMYRENYSGKLANPARVAVSPSGAGAVEKQRFFQKLLAWGVNTVFGLPPGWDIRILESNGRGFEIFTQTIDSADKEFMIGVSGQVVTTNGGTGFANADIHATIRSDLIQSDGDGLATTINLQGLRPVVNRLFGGGARGRVAWDTRPPADLKAEADAMGAVGDALDKANAALAPYGIRVDGAEVAKRFKLPVTPTALAPVAPPPGALPAANDDVDPATGDDDAPAEPSASARLAAKMTDAGVARCEHGASNRCRLCGIERARDFTVGPDGNHTWHVAWQPIGGADPAPAPAPSEEAA